MGRWCWVTGVTVDNILGLKWTRKSKPCVFQLWQSLPGAGAQQPTELQVLFVHIDPEKDLNLPLETNASCLQHPWDKYTRWRLPEQYNHVPSLPICSFTPVGLRESTWANYVTGELLSWGFPLPLFRSCNGKKKKRKKKSQWLYLCIFLTIFKLSSSSSS